jgi:hypothetical protein
MQPKYKMRKSKEHRNFGYEVKTLCIKEKNHFMAVKPKKSANRRNS